MSAELLRTITTLEQDARVALDAAAHADAVHAVKVQFLGRKGALTDILKQMRDLSPDERKQVGESANRVKTWLESACEEKLGALQSVAVSKAAADQIDITLPGRVVREVGGLHPVLATMREISAIFTDLGFSIFDGPEIETEYYNFEALNVPADHPARDMQDTLYIDGTHPPHLLRTHTSNVQIRVMQGHQPPIRMIAPGAVFRRDDIDQTHSPMFHQVEGLLVDTHVTFAHLKGVLGHFVDRFFGAGVITRFRPSFFPFTEPSAEMDLGFVRTDHGRRLARHGEAVDGWMEIMGCGMVDPNVFTAVGYDPQTVSGFAFGMGVERIAMLKHGVRDIRDFFESDVRFLAQFRVM